MTFFFYFWTKKKSKASKWPSKLVKKPLKKKNVFRFYPVETYSLHCCTQHASLGAGCTRMHVARGGPTANETPESHSARVPVAKQMYIFNLEMNVLYDLI